MTARPCKACGGAIEHVNRLVRYCSEPCRRRAAVLRAQAWEEARRLDDPDRAAARSAQHTARARRAQAADPDGWSARRRIHGATYRAARSPQDLEDARAYKRAWWAANRTRVLAARRAAWDGLTQEERALAREATRDYMRAYHQARYERLRADPAAYVRARREAREHLREWRRGVARERMLADLHHMGDRS